MIKTVNDIVWEAIYTGKNAAPWVMSCYDNVTPGLGFARVAINENQVMGMIDYNPYTVHKNMVLVIQHLKIGTEPSGNRLVLFLVRSTNPNFVEKAATQIEKYTDTISYNIKNGIWFKEGTIVDILSNNKEAIDLIIYTQVSGILVNVSEAFKKERG